MIGFLLPLALADTTIPATSPFVTEIGRFDRPTPSTIRGSWTGVAVQLEAQGTTFSAAVNDQGDNYLQVEINGEMGDVIHLQQGENKFSAKLPPGPCRIRLVKRTEAFVGPITFESFQTDGKFLPSRPMKRLIEFVGDSITCGYGNEGANEHEHFKPSTENGDQSYAWIAARSVGAGASIIAWSGRKMWPDNTTPSIYDLVIPTDPTTQWDFAGHEKPDAVLINLATNDFGRGNPDKSGWCGAYEAFITKLRGLYPNAMIYCSIGSMMSDNYPPSQHALTTLRDYIATIVADKKRAGDMKVGEIEFDMQKQSDGLGADYHPSVKTDGIMAAKLVERLKQDLHW